MHASKGAGLSFFRGAGAFVLSKRNKRASGQFLQLRSDFKTRLKPLKRNAGSRQSRSHAKITPRCETREDRSSVGATLSTTYEIPRRFNRFLNRSPVKGVLRKNMRRLRAQIDTSPHVARINGIDGILHVLDAFLAGHSANFQIERMLVVRLVRIAHALRLEFLRRVFRAAAAAVVL